MGKMEKVVIFGVGDIASVAHFYLTHDSPHEVVAFTVDREFIRENELLGLPIVPFEEIEVSYPPNKFKMFVPISYKNVNKLRAKKYYQAREKGYELISYISSKAITWPGLVIGDNCFIMENNVIQPFVEIGNDVIMWSGNHIGHHTIIKDHCFLASHVVVSGSVSVEPYSFLGVNATIRDSITIARECVIGAGAIILRNTKEKCVYIGAGAKLYSRDSSQIDI